ncbi:MAG: rhodanese-related sulfurtransferase, partial [Mycoplasmataceae bacterium]|nr:rhodanese-related sulfurtransferase [Mycoplasmataceae bacterium]
ICALYKFVRLENHLALQSPLLEKMSSLDVKGTLLLAAEGINGTIAGSQKSIEQVLEFLQAQENLGAIVHKESFSDNNPFHRTKVKLKKEIVTMGIEGIDPNQVVGTDVKPKDWNALISDPEVLLVDTRNYYEVQVGTFKDAINPVTDSFREFPDYVKQHFDPEKHKKVAMYCTGGIRCEKSTAYMKEQGFEEVYHLEGGILKYLEEVPEDETLWEGECYVFDERITVNHQLEKGIYDQCNACRLPITESDKQNEHYIHGVSCPHCFDKTTAQQKARFAEREKQIKLADQRGEAHIGADSAKTIAIHRAEKQQLKENQRQASLQKQHR